MKLNCESKSGSEKILAGIALGVLALVSARGAERFFTWRDNRLMYKANPDLRRLGTEVKVVAERQKRASLLGQAVYKEAHQNI